MKKKTKRLIIAGCAATAFAVFTVFACDNRLSVENYSITTSKISGNIRIIFISDLHNNIYGKQQSELISEIDKANPDIVIFGGDIASKSLKEQPSNSYYLSKYLARKYPCYYSMGNHEYERGDSGYIKKCLTSYGVKVLEGNGEVITLSDNRKIEICGIFDPDAYFEKDGEYISQLEAVTAEADSDIYRVLISHFPEDINTVLKANFDLVLSGHAHGGQIRIPYILENGLYAPGQGIFPKYTSGEFIHGNTIQIVSRGLCRDMPFINIPRVFNRPELSVIDITTEE